MSSTKKLVSLNKNFYLVTEPSEMGCKVDDIESDLGLGSASLVVLENATYKLIGETISVSCTTGRIFVPQLGESNTQRVIQCG